MARPDTPAGRGWSLPAETAPHRRCWMAWPCRDAAFGGAESLALARKAWVAVARAIRRFEPVVMVARPDDAAWAGDALGPEIEVLPLPLDDSWIRDTGPSFMLDAAGRPAAVAWIFNGWGGKFAPIDADAALAGRLVARLGIAGLRAPFVLEGGAVHVDGDGTALVTDSVLLNPNRHPADDGAAPDRAHVERLLVDWLGVRRVIWLAGGWQGDDDTDGHIDTVACFVRPGVVLVQVCDDPADPNHAVSGENLARLRAASDARDRSPEIVTVGQPARREEDGHRLPLSYVNFYLANGGLVAPVFGDPADRAALDTLAGLFPAREVVPVPAIDIFRGGGGIHCITLGEPLT